MPLTMLEAQAAASLAVCGLVVSFTTVVQRSSSGRLRSATNSISPIDVFPE